MLKRMAALFLASCMLLSLCSCGDNPSSTSVADGSQATSAKDTLVVGLYSEPIDMNPHMQANQYSQMPKHQMYETLFITDGDGVMQPVLATGYEYVDDTTLIITLREGVQFHSGGEMTAKDVLFSLKLISESLNAQIATEHVDVENCKAINDYTVEIKMKEPFAAEINYLNWPLTAIVSEDGYSQIDGDYTKMSIGTGPYKLVEYVKDSHTSMTAFEGYWEEDKPYIQNLTFRVIAEDTTRSLELQSGGIDVATNLASMDVDSIENSPDTYVIRKPTFQTTYLFMNQNNKYLADYNVRKAILSAIDWKSAIEVAFGQRGEYSSSMLTDGVEGAVELNPIPYDPEAAKQILTDAGYQEGQIELNIYTNTLDVRVRLAEMIQGFLDQIGIKVNVVSLEASAFSAAYSAGEHDLLLMGFFASTGEPSRVMDYFTSDSVYKNVMNYQNKEFDNMVDTAMTTIDSDTRIKMYGDAQRLLYEDLMVYPIAVNVMLVGLQNNVQGLELDSLFECHEFKNVYFQNSI